MVPIHGSFAQVRENFAAQFTPDGRDFVYRRGMHGAAYRVTVAERDGFVAAFDRGLRWMFWGVIAATVAILSLLEWQPGLLPRAVRPWHESIGIGVVTLATVAVWWRLWLAPARELERRMPVAPPLGRAARRSVNLARLSWGPLVFGAGLCLFLIVTAVRAWSIGGSAWDYVVAGAVGLAFFVTVGVVKWRLR